MNEVKGHKIDADGYYVEDVFVDPNNVPDDVIVEGWNIPLAKPKWDGTQWVEGQDMSTQLAYLKSVKKASLSTQCNQSICGGFPSSALGVEHTYPSDEEAQRNFHSELDRIRLDSTYTTIYFKTFDSGYLAHTIAQFTQVFLDGHTYGRQQIAKLNQLKADVDGVTDPKDLDNITW